MTRDHIAQVSLLVALALGAGAAHAWAGICTPTGEEVCDGVDNDCDEFVDEGLPTNDFYLDSDDDGYGDPAFPMQSCQGSLEGYVLNDADCNDATSDAFPGNTEVCDGIDNDCNLTIDDVDGLESDLSNCGACGNVCGDHNAVPACSAGQCLLDCADGYFDADMAPANGCECAPTGEETCDGVDNDCDGMIDEGTGTLMTYYLDSDGDGFGDVGASVEACAPPEDYVADATDCNDSDVNINPSATEVCDELDTDDNCDGLADELTPGLFCGPPLDVDGDGAILPLTDLLLLLRWGFNFTGEVLTSGAVNLGGCTRCDAASIVSYIQSHLQSAP